MIVANDQILGQINNCIKHKNVKQLNNKAITRLMSYWGLIIIAHINVL